jgi:hypothetical protein
LDPGGNDGLHRPGLRFLETSRFRRETQAFGGWFSLDFLGFSRSNLDLSMGYTKFSTENFCSRFCGRETTVETAGPRFGMRKGRVVHGASLLEFLIFCKQLPPELFLRAASSQKQTTL